MKINTSGLAVAAVFYGLLWYAFQSDVDYGAMQALAVVVLTLAAGWITVGVIARSPFGLLWPRRHDRKKEQPPRIRVILLP